MQLCWHMIVGDSSTVGAAMALRQKMLLLILGGINAHVFVPLPD